MNTTTAKVLVKGESIVIIHDLGAETGTLLGWTDFGSTPGRMPNVRVDVQFGDGTISSWGYSHVDSIKTLVARNNNI